MIRRHTAGLLASVLMFVFSTATALTLDDLQSQIDAGDYQAAARNARAYLQIHPGNRDARFLRARALAGQDQTQAAINAFKALANDYPLRPEPANNLAVLYAHQGQYEQARRWLEKALATQPAYATAHRNLGDVYTALADLAYRKALGVTDAASKTPLTMLDRFYYARESVPPAAGQNTDDKASSQADNEPSAPPAGHSRSILQTVRAWARAWTRQDFAAYQQFYSADFEPGDQTSRQQWLAEREARLAEPEAIHISIDNVSIAPLSKQRVRVEFVQQYKSERYTDTIGKKLILERTGAGWRIIREYDLPDS